MASGIVTILQSAAQNDFFTLLLPFLLSYIVFFLALKNVPIVGNADNKTKMSAIISVILSLFTVYFLYQNPVYQSFFVGYSARIAIGMVGILGLLVFLGILGIDMDGKEVPIITILVIAGATGAFFMSKGIYAFLPRAAIPVIGYTPRQIFDFLMNSGLLYLVIIGGGIYWATVDTDDDADRGDIFKKLFTSS
ncbi:MAG: hypothetical protein ABEJ99_05800 [Candidatus Nanohaloarchaea archaeon]